MSPHPPSASTLDDLPLYLSRIYYAFLGHLEGELTATGLAGELKPGMGHVLLALYEQDDCIIKDIAARVEIAPATLSSLLTRMERSGVVVRARCGQDGRAIRVRLTDKGRALRAAVEGFHARVLATVQEGLSAAEIAETKRLLSHILGSLRRANVETVKA